jgi:hypothetical protein
MKAKSIKGKSAEEIYMDLKNLKMNEFFVPPAEAGGKSEAGRKSEVGDKTKAGDKS